MKALAKNPLNRYQSAGEMRSDVQRAIANQPVQAEAVMTDAERTQFIARTPPPIVPDRRQVFDDDEDDHHRRTGLVWAAVVIALLLVIGLTGFLISRVGDGGGSQQVTLQSVVGQTPQAAASALRKQGFQPVKGPDSVGPCRDQTGEVQVQEGNVCLTTPAPGAQVAKGSAVTYRLFHRKLSSVPFVEGMSFADAVQKLGQNHLTYTRKNVFSAAKEGTVLSQGTSAYSTVKPGTKILLRVSTGTLQVPDITGMDIDAAKDAIPQQFKIVVRERTTRKQKLDRQVAAQDPGKGAYPVSKQIILYVYRYSQPLPSCTTPPPSDSASPGHGHADPPGRPCQCPTTSSASPTATPTS